jgi:hypothetical protein
MKEKLISLLHYFIQIQIEKDTFIKTLTDQLILVKYILLLLLPQAEAIKDIEPRVDLESINQEENLGDTLESVSGHIDTSHANHVNNSSPIQNK